MPETREIPAGRTLLAEYGDVAESDLARVETLETREVHGREYRLIHSSPGFECAGSVMRWTNGYWGIRFESGGAIQGRQFKTEEEARSLLSVWVTNRLAQYAEEA